jgi:hypothetical protein
MLTSSASVDGASVEGARVAPATPAAPGQRDHPEGGAAGCQELR